MGTFRIEIEAVGGHGCQREKKDGDTLYGCRNMDCPDCRAREFVKTLQNTGCSVSSATLTHWPGEESEVKDDLITGVRKGSFN